MSNFLQWLWPKKVIWKKQLDSVLSGARKSLNFLKIVCRHLWGQDTSTVIHLALSFVRSKLTYRQEVYFSTSKSFLFFLPNYIDSKSVNLALGIPVHASTVSSYREAGIVIVPLEFRKPALANYFVRASSVEIFTNEELIFFNCHLLKVIFRNSDLFPNCTINTFPTDVHSILSRWPIYCWRVQFIHWFELYMSVYLCYVC